MMPKSLQDTVKFSLGKKAETGLKACPYPTRDREGGRDCSCYTPHVRRLHLSQLGTGRGVGEETKREPDPVGTLSDSWASPGPPADAGSRTNVGSAALLGAPHAQLGRHLCRLSGQRLQLFLVVPHPAARIRANQHAPCLSAAVLPEAAASATKVSESDLGSPNPVTAPARCWAGCAALIYGSARLNRVRREGDGPSLNNRQTY